MVTKEDEKIMESLSDRSRRERSERRRNRRRSGLIFGNMSISAWHRGRCFGNSSDRIGYTECR